MKFETRVLWSVLVALVAAMGSACGDGGNGSQANEPPTASFTFSCIDLSCAFDGSASSDPDGSIASYSWAFGDGGTASGATAAHTYELAGSRTVTLTVTDDDGATGSAAQNVTVSEGDVTVLPVYEYEVASVPPDDPIVVDVPFGEGVRLELGCIYGCPNLKGRYDLEEGNFTIDAGAHLTVRELNQPAQLFGIFDIAVTETLTVPFESRPTSGALAVDSYLAVGAGLGFVDVTILPAGAGVRLALDETNDGVIDAEVVKTWAEFEEIFGSDAPQWQQLGAFGYAVMVDFMPELLEYGIAGILLVETTAEVLPSLSPVTGECAAFSSFGLSVPPPPPVVPDQGFETFTWFDDAASGDVNAGDSFSLDFDYCLLTYFPEDDSDLNNGLIGMNSWTEVVTDGVLTRVGFEGTSPAGKPGGLVFEDFEMWAVWDADGSGPGTATESSLEATVNGRMTVVFFAPVE